MSGTQTYSDELVTCESCETAFVFRVPEQRRMYEVRGEVTVPTECPACRQGDDETGWQGDEKTGRRRDEKTGRQRDEETGRWRGEVKWFDIQKGYGFIRKPDGEEIFFHRNSLAASANPRDMAEGRQVSFEEQESSKGPEAVEVKLLG
ncbi:MAG: Cold shock-like protein [Anaerolineales bacterium]|nr:Cold shock-like protein [Anaerolineales bacterium]